MAKKRKKRRRKPKPEEMVTSNPKGFLEFKDPPKDTHLAMFEELHSQPNATVDITKSFLVLCTPRCGSTMFAEALNSSGRTGIIEEWFNYEYFNAWEHVTGRKFDLHDYVDWVSLKTTRNTGIFALKWHIGQLYTMHDDFNLGIESINFDHSVYLYRRDKIAQAVSLVRAVATDQFRSYETAKKDVKYTRWGIASGLENIAKFDQFVNDQLQKYIDARYAYEDFRDLRCPAYNDTLVALGCEPCERFSTGRLKKQRDGESVAAAIDFRQYILGEIE